MPVIQPKHKPKIIKGNGISYNPETFINEKIPYFQMASSEEILKAIQPYEYAEGKKVISFDTETYKYFEDSHQVPPSIVRRWVGSGKKAHPQDFPFSISLCDGTNSFVVYDTYENDFKEFKKLAPLFLDSTIEKIAHNTKFDMHMIANIGMKIKGKLHDTVVLAKIVNENRPSFVLENLVEHKPNSIVKFSYMVDTYKQMNKVHDYRLIPKELMTQYTCADVWNAMLLFKDEYPKLAPENLLNLYNTEMEEMIVLYSIERYGMKTDAAYEQPLKEDLRKIVDESEADIYKEAGKLFNINSGKQLYNTLLSLGVSKDSFSYTEKGNPILDKNALQSLADKGISLVKKILNYRKNEKLLSTYAIGISEQYDSEHRVHSSINQTEAVTGRMSITKPALQTLPKKDKRIRTYFIPENGHRLYFLDLDQVEYRLFAHYAKAKELLKAIAQGYDVHAATAGIIFHIPVDNIINGMAKQEKLKEEIKVETDEVKLAEMNKEIDNLQKYTDMRSKGKTINFAMIYGVGIGHLCELLHCSQTEAADLKATYFAGIPEAKPFIQLVEYVIKARGWVKNWYGRRRRLDADDCYKAPNALIQGCAADYIKHKMVLMYKFIMYHKLKTTFRNVIHDETILDVPEEEQKYVPYLRWLQSDFKNFRCPITAGAEYTDSNWGHKQEIDIAFKEPTDKAFINYNVFDGSVFDIYKEA